MKLDVKVPKGKVVAMMKAEIKRLKSENDRLKRRLDLADRRWKDHQEEAQEVREMHRKFKEVVAEFTDHDSCYD